MFERFTDRARTGRRPGPRRSPDAQPQLHRHRAHPARPDPRGRGRRRQGAGVARHLAGRRAPARSRRSSARASRRRAGTSRSRRAPRRCWSCRLREALQLGHNYIGTEHILLGLIREGEGVAAQVLVKLGADLSRVRQQVIQLLSRLPGQGDREAGTGGRGGEAGNPSTLAWCSTSSAATSPSRPRGGQARPGDRPREGDRAGHAGAVAAAPRTTRC